jgi:hypothetical protein
MSRDMPIVRRIWIHPGADVMNVTTAQMMSSATAAIMPKSMGEIVDL